LAPTGIGKLDRSEEGAAVDQLLSQFTVSSNGFTEEGLLNARNIKQAALWIRA